MNAAGRSDKSEQYLFLCGFLLALMAFLRGLDVTADFDLTVTDPCIETDLRVHGRAMDDLTISHREL